MGNAARAYCDATIINTINDPARVKQYRERLSKAKEEGRVHDELASIKAEIMDGHLSAIKECYESILKLHKAVKDIDLKQSETGASISDILKSMNINMGGKQVYGIRSIEEVARAYSINMNKPLVAAHRSPHYNSFKAGDVDDIIAKAIIDGTPPENKALAPIIAAVRSTNKTMLDYSRRAGAAVKERLDYVTRQCHDPSRIGAVPMEEWVADAARAYKPSRSMTPQEWRETLEGCYSAFVSGIHFRYDATLGDYFPMADGSHGAGNLVYKAEAGRSLIARSGEAWIAYNRKYGLGSIYETLQHEIEVSSRRCALMERWGSNPDKTFRDLLSTMETRRPDESLIYGLNSLDHSRLKAAIETGKWDKIKAVVKQLPEEIREGATQYARATMNLKDIRDNRRAIEHSFKTICGGYSAPDAPKWFNVAGQWLRWAQQFKLGSASISAIGDMGFMARELKFQHIAGLADGLSRTIEAVRLYATSTGNARMVYECLGAAEEVMMFERTNMFADPLSRTQKNISVGFFKLNGLTTVTKHYKAGFQGLLCNHAAQQAHLPWGSLDDQYRKVLGHYGIGEAEWAVMVKNTVDLPSGKRLITPDSIRTNAAEINPNGLDLEEVAAQWQMYLSDSANRAVPTQGLREQTDLQFHTEPGSFINELTKCYMQFTSYAYTVATRVLRRDVAWASTPAQQAKEVLATLGIGLMGGYMTLQLKQLVKGQKPLGMDENNWAKVLGMSFVQGGGVGIYSDLIAKSMQDERGMNSYEVVLGPSGQSINQIRKAVMSVTKGTAEEMDEGLSFGAALDEATKASTKKWVDVVRPYTNLWFARYALDAGLYWQLINMANPDYLEEYEDNLRETKGSEYWSWSAPTTVTP